MENRSGGMTIIEHYDSTIYLRVIRAICQTYELPSTSSSLPSSKQRRALRTLVGVYTRCSEDGMLTTEIFDLVKAAMTKSQFARLLATVENGKS
jgi:hypothetical protein